MPGRSDNSVVPKEAELTDPVDRDVGGIVADDLDRERRRGTLQQSRQLVPAAGEFGANVASARNIDNEVRRRLHRSRRAQGIGVGDVFVELGVQLHHALGARLTVLGEHEVLVQFENVGVGVGGDLPLFRRLEAHGLALQRRDALKPQALIDLQQAVSRLLRAGFEILGDAKRRPGRKKVSVGQRVQAFAHSLVERHLVCGNARPRERLPGRPPFGIQFERRLEAFDRGVQGKFALEIEALVGRCDDGIEIPCPGESGQRRAMARRNRHSQFEQSHGLLAVGRFESRACVG